MNDKVTRARIALAEFAISALSLYVRDLKDAKEPTMTLRQIAQSILDSLDASSSAPDPTRPVPFVERCGCGREKHATTSCSICDNDE